MQANKKNSNNGEVKRKMLKFNIRRRMIVLRGKQKMDSIMKNIKDTMEI